MSFSSAVKEEIIDKKINGPCCQKAQTAGVLAGVALSTDSSFSISSESASVSQYILKRLLKSGRTSAALTVSQSGQKYTVKGESAFLAANPLEVFIKKDCCKAAFFSGLFLSCGHISDPEKEYRLEFAFLGKNEALRIAQLFSDSGLEVKYSKRANRHLLYLKDSTMMEDFLTFVGATDSCLKLMEVKVEKTVKNNTNRKANFEQANYCRTYDKSRMQLAAIQKIRDSGKYQELSDSLKFTICLREQNEDASLQELSEISGVSRSGLNHRLNRLLEIANDL